MAATCAPIVKLVSSSTAICSSVAGGGVEEGKVDEDGLAARCAVSGGGTGRAWLPPSAMTGWLPLAGLKRSLEPWAGS